MTTTKTELDFSYEPADFFEAFTAVNGPNGQLTLDAGKAVYVLAVPTDPIPRALLHAVSEEISNVLKLRQMLVHKPFQLSGPSITQHQAEGGQNRVILVGVAEMVTASDGFDCTITDAAGNVIADTKAERLKAETDFLASLLPKMKHPTLAKMVDSYCGAVKDSADELIHLFEITEAADTHFDGDRKARSALGIGKSEWDAIDALANNKHILQGRHRGQQTQGMRDATREELDKARSVARRIIEIFASNLPQ